MSLTRRLDTVKEAYKNNDAELLKRSHRQFKLGSDKESGIEDYLKSVVYGGLDGIITTFAVVAGVAGASLESSVVLILGFANLIADGLSMAVGDYLSTKAENEYHQLEQERETWEVENDPDGEREETIELFEAQGFPNEDALAITEILSKNKKAWVHFMMVNEHEILPDNESPIFNAVATFASFVVFGFIPLSIYVTLFVFEISISGHFAVASVMTACTLFLLGAIKTKITQRNWFYSGLEMLLVGGLAAACAYYIGEGFATWIGNR